MQWRCVISITLCIAHSVGWDVSASTASSLSCASWRGCAQLLITWLTNASQWELLHRDLPADPRVGNTHHVGADEQMQMQGGEEAFAEGWKGHILTACGPLHDCAWVCACQTSWFLSLNWIWR